jgi:ankyrin repeat protein
MPGVITTCAKCGAQYSWNMDYQEYPDCPRCGYNAMKVDEAKRDKCLCAAERGDLAGVKKTLRDPDVRKNLNAGPLTILHHAVSGNQIDVVKYLLSQGAEPDTAYPQAGNETPLHIAASKGYLDIAKVLIDSGARVDARDSTGAKPIDKAADDATRALLQPYDNKISLISDFFAAIKAGEVEKVEDFLKRGIDPNQKDPSENKFGVVCGISPLCYAMDNQERGRQLAEVLLRHGADPNIRRNAGISALHDAAMNGRADIAELLIEQGAEVDVRDDSGYKSTPLHEACDEGHVNVAKVLLKHGANVNAPDKDGNTPIHRAAMHKRSYYEFSLFQVLLDAGGTLDVNDLPVVYVTDKKAVPNPAMNAYLKSYAEQNPTSPQATGPIRRRKRTEESSGRDSIATANKKPKKGCFIATACYGSPMCAEVLLLQEFRDRCLTRSVLGRAAVRLYYYLSPPLAAAISRSPYLRMLVRRVLVAPAVRLVSALFGARMTRMK